MDASREKPEMRCRTCGYDLRGLPEHRCPECGRAFDPARPITYLSRPVNGIAMLSGAILAYVLYALPIAVGASPLADVVPMIVIPVGPASIISGALLGGLVFRRCWRIVRDNEPWIIGAWAIWPAMLLGAGAFALFIIATLGSLLYHHLF